MTPTNKPSPESVERARNLCANPVCDKMDEYCGVCGVCAAIARALDEAERRGAEKAAVIVSRWHYKKGGYSAIAWEIREKLCGEASHE